MKSIMIVHDCEGWAFHRWSQGIEKYAPDWCNVTTVDLPEFSGFTQRPQSLEKYDAICALSWTQSPTLTRVRNHLKRYVTVLAHDGVRHDDGRDLRGMKKAKLSNITRTLHQQSVTNDRNRRVALQKLPQFDAVISINPTLHEWAESNGLKSTYLTAGVDTEVFNVNRNPDRVFTVGWCGQDTEPSIKGMRELLHPLIDSFSPDDMVYFDIHDSGRYDGGCKTLEEMLDWYAGLDVLLSTSISEGGPNPVFEAQSCGIPVVTTDVGDVRSVVGVEPASGFIVPAYQSHVEAMDRAERMRNAIMFIRDDSGGRQMMRYIAREQAKRVCWSVLADRWCELIAGSKP